MKLNKLKNKRGGLILVAILIFSFSIFNIAFAQDDFVGPRQYLVVCGLGDSLPCTLCDIWALADKVINFVLFTLATPILIIVLIAGGFIYLTSGGNPKRTETAKGLITSAIFGIVIAFAAWLIVDTILKTLVKGNFTIAWQKIGECPKPLEPEIPDLSKLPKRQIIVPSGTYTETEARDALEGFSLPGERVLINKRPCQCAMRDDSRCANCTNVAGLPKSAVDYLRLVQEYCVSGEILDCRFVLSGGTESHLHSENTRHAPRNSVVDVVPNTKTQAVYRALIDAASGVTAVRRCEDKDGKHILDCAVTTTNHIHFEFSR